MADAGQQQENVSNTTNTARTPTAPKKKTRRLAKASTQEKERVFQWIHNLQEWPTQQLLEEYLQENVATHDRTYYREPTSTIKQAAQRLQVIATKVRQDYLKKDGKSRFRREENKFWKTHLMRILSAAKVSGDSVLLRTASKIFKLPHACIDKHFKQRKQEYISNKGPHYEMGLERCTTCKTKTKIIGGACILVTHQEIVKEQKMQKAREKKLIDDAAKKARTVKCSCGCWALLRPSQSSPCLEKKDRNNKIISSTPIISLTADTIKQEKLAGRCGGSHGHGAVDIRAIQFHDGKCDICSGLAGVFCSGHDHCTCIDGPYVLRHCKRHGFVPGRPTIAPGHTHCNGCRNDKKKRNKFGAQLRVKKRKKEDHYLRCTFACR